MRVPLTGAPMTAPIEDSTAAMIASATSASISVKPLVPSEQLLRDNVDASCQPGSANLNAHPRPRQCNHAAARHSRRKEVDRPAGTSVRAARRQYRIQRDVAGQANDAVADAGADRSGGGIDLGG